MALIAIILAVLVMILSIAIVMGFKQQITHKIYSLDAHIKVSNAPTGDNDFEPTVNISEFLADIKQNPELESQLGSVSLVADKSAILKTYNDFYGIRFRGIDNAANLDFIEQSIIEGSMPDFHSDPNATLLSLTVAKRLKLHAGDKVLAYFFDNKIKVRRLNIAAVFSTDFDAFDNNFIIGNISLIQQINGWNRDTGNFISINTKHTPNIEAIARELSTAVTSLYSTGKTATLFNITTTHQNNVAFFSWLSMLDMNVIIILTLMVVVATFTLISALLMIVLERIRLIGLLKALGTTNASIRHTFILLTGKLIIKALLIGNAVGIVVAMVQKYFHIIPLNPETYYMPWVPIHLTAGAIITLNVSILFLAYLTLIVPSFIIASIKPNTTLRFE